MNETVSKHGLPTRGECRGCKRYGGALVNEARRKPTFVLHPLMFNWVIVGSNCWVLVQVASKTHYMFHNEKVHITIKKLPELRTILQKNSGPLQPWSATLRNDHVIVKYIRSSLCLVCVFLFF
jgi:hypothetical protein